MNTTVSTSVDEHVSLHPPASLEHILGRRAVSLADRIALRLGLALITWSRRSRLVGERPGRDDQRARHYHHAERANREREAERRLLLNLPPR